MTECFRMHKDPTGVLNNEGTPSRKTYVDTRLPARTTSTSESRIYAALYCAIAAVIILSWWFED